MLLISANSFARGPREIVYIVVCSERVWRFEQSGTADAHSTISADLCPPLQSIDVHSLSCGIAATVISKPTWQRHGVCVGAAWQLHGTPR